MRRREFITLLGGAAGWPLALRAQQSAMPVVGFLSGRSVADSVAEVREFHRGLAEAGFIEGKNVAIEFRWANGRYDRLAALASELVGQRVAVIAAVGGGGSGLAAKAATATIPIVFATGGDAVKIGLVTSFNRPGGHVTGVNIIFGALGAKRLELLHNLVPAADAVGMLVNLDYPSAPLEVQDVEAAGRKLGLRMHIFNARTEGDIEPAFADFAEKKVKALLVADDPFFQGHRPRILGMAARQGLPAIYFSRDFVDAGGLMSYGPNLPDAYRLVAVYCGRILKGEKPADLPVVQPTTFELVINLRSARALALDVPPILLTRADEVIE
jgi:putative tryptophan/tyrosine transport system substrate-binding protein